MHMLVNRAYAPQACAGVLVQIGRIVWLSILCPSNLCCPATAYAIPLISRVLSVLIGSVRRTNTLHAARIAPSSLTSLVGANPLGSVIMSRYARRRNS
ncbi:hypothetical protein OH77DRAFT_116906 [Trametes cingulata]|nr:hypothetical protein OH77DRAFT_116906 [Trametes cingulata]